MQTSTELQPRDVGGSGRHKPLQAPLCTDGSGALGNWNTKGTSPSLLTPNPASVDSKAGFQPQAQRALFYFPPSFTQGELLLLHIARKHG